MARKVAKRTMCMMFFWVVFNVNWCVNWSICIVCERYTERLTERLTERFLYVNYMINIQIQKTHWTLDWTIHWTIDWTIFDVYQNRLPNPCFRMFWICQFTFINQSLNFFMFIMLFRPKSISPRITCYVVLTHGKTMLR